MLDNKVRINKLFLSGIFYWISLTISFVYALQVHWSSDFPLHFSILKYCCATISVIIMLYVIPNNESITSLFLITILEMVVLPIAIIYACQDRESLYYVSIVVSFIIVELLVSYRAPSHITYRFNSINLSNIVILFSLIVIIITVFSIFRERGVPTLEALNLSRIYEIRSSYTLSKNGLRLFRVTSKTLIPFVLAVCFVKKKYGHIVLLLFMELLFFLWLGHKTVLFEIGILVIAYYISKRKNPAFFFSWSMGVGCILMSVLEGQSLQNERGIGSLIYWGYSLLVRRVLFLPAYLKYCYYDFFVLKDNALEGVWGTFISPIMTGTA